MEHRHGEFAQARLSPEMASQRLLVLDFVRHYIARWGASPSHGEIGHALGIDRSRVRRAIRSLSADGLILRTPGSRGLAIPDAEAAAIRQLQAVGWTIDAARRRVAKPTLPPVPELDYPEGEEDRRDGSTADRSGDAGAQGA